MRTIDAGHAELLQEDPKCALTKTALRRLIVSGQLASVRIGSKYLFDLDNLLDFLRGNAPEPVTEAQESGGLSYDRR